MKKERFKRILAFYLALNIIFEVVSPTAAYALTSGPGQPEMASFEPVGTTEMVNTFTGDFNYNIPLLTVPGPNGGYPVNLAYHAGIGMEDEASWVGLGWNINPGVINRQMRGVPDDFSGTEMIQKQTNMRPNKTVGINFGFPFTSVPEIWGFKYKQTLKLGAQWNNYRGFGVIAGGSLSGQSQNNNNLSVQASLEYNSLAGETNLTAGVNLASKRNESNVFGASVRLNSLQGLKDLNFTYKKTQKYPTGTYIDVKDANGEVLGTMKGYYDGTMTRNSGGVSFASSAFVPPSDVPQSGFNISTEFSLGFDALGIDNRFQINASYDQTKLDNSELEFNAYGYLYADQRTRSMKNEFDGDNYRLMDFNREREVTPSKDIPSLPAPISTYDIYLVNGQGVGGAFRPFRTDIGLLVDPEIRGENFGGSIGVEVGAGYPNYNVGVNLAVNYSKSYTGPWHKPELWKDIQSRTHKGSTYFKAAGEIVADEEEENELNMKNTAFPVTAMISVPDFSDLSVDPTDMQELMSPLVDIRVNNTNGIIGTKDHYSTKRTRSQLMSYKTFSEVSALPGYQANWVDKSVYAEGTTPLTASSISNFNPGGNQLAEISVTNPDGNRYIYALPAQNSSQREVSFSVDPALRSSPDGKIVNYLGGTDNSTGNDQADDHFFTSTRIPSYVHSYMLTAIVSPDYIDLKDDGLTADDFGYWVKFNYTKTSSDYKWRSPFSGANYLEGYISNKTDDKAGYVYGVKEIWYLNSIETKTHLASFVLESRSDANGASQEDQGYTIAPNTGNMDQGNGSRRLKKISLVSKADASRPLKEVNFDYSYELCKNTLNSAASGNGKLTLKSVWFSYLGNEKGRLSPYMFDYHQGNADENPNYNILQGDRWGNYQQNTFGVNSLAFPYTPQGSDYNNDNVSDDADTQKRNAHASAWSLKEITLPSGGKIKVDYEADDYAYVHDREAMEMVRVVGFSDSPGGTISSVMKDKNQYLFFQINDEDSVNTNADVQKYISGLKEIYFNVFIKLKKNGVGGVMQDDYVSGYADVDQSATAGIITGYNDLNSYNPAKPMKLGYLKLKRVSIHDKPVGAPFTHPFRKAAWQYLKLKRPDILFPATNNGSGGGIQFVTQVANSIIGLFQSTAQLFTGFYSYCEAAGFGKEMSTNTNHPSFIRLKTPDGVKYGGGHRVKSIKLSDSWKGEKSTANPNADNPSVYGQEYSYRLPDGRSSGVAAYEPMIGGEEIPYRKPIRYSSEYFILKNENLYIEEPVGENFYPAASVGYSKVVVRNIGQKETPLPGANDVTVAKQGITVYEYYTTKDFKYDIKPGGLTHEKFNPKITVPFIGSVGFENHGFSQSMTVVTNDMHGKTKSVATYKSTADMNNAATLPVSKVEYIYNTDGVGKVSGKVTALFGDGYYRETTMGATLDQYIDMRETYGVSMNQGIQTNVYGMIILAVPVPVFIPVPIINYSESLNKTVVSMNVKNQAGILMETRTFSEGSTVVQKNLMFDAYSGQPLLTSVTNDFDKPVFKYDYAAHWAYDGMANAYKTDRAVAVFNTNSASQIVLSTGSVFSSLNTVNSISEFTPGDELMVRLGALTKKAWIKSVNVAAGTAELVTATGANAYGSNVSDIIGVVIRSGRRNQQSASNASIVSLTDPIGDRKFQLFDDYNLHASPTALTSTDCGSGQLRNYNITAGVSGSKYIITFESAATMGEDACDVTITFPDNNAINWSAVNLKKAGKKVYALHPSTNAILATGDLKDECGLTECLDGVLQASAFEFKDQDWKYDYADFGDIYVKIGSTPQLIATAVADAQRNPYRIGISGIWRMEKSYAYQTERKQTLDVSHQERTKIQEDGTFKEFVLFNWNKDVNPAIKQNEKWTMLNEVTKYSPYGFEVENENALHIKSSALYGYDNSVPTAIASASSYYEIAFDGFEDYPAGTTNYVAAPFKRGHVNLNTASGSIPFDNANSHTGKYSLKGQGSQVIQSIVNPSSPGLFTFQVTPGQKYIVSAWFKSADGSPEIGVTTGAAPVEVHRDKVKIDGWEKIEATFTVNSSLLPVTIKFMAIGSTGNWYLDDVRIQPFKSVMKSYVYDPKTLWLMAELDNQNYATFYNYDEEGTLTQVKKETVNGIQTLKTTRSNIARP